jgi:hypothetical protein
MGVSSSPGVACGSRSLCFAGSLPQVWLSGTDGFGGLIAVARILMLGQPFRVGLAWCGQRDLDLGSTLADELNFKKSRH